MDSIAMKKIYDELCMNLEKSKAAIQLLIKHRALSKTCDVYPMLLSDMIEDLENRFKNTN